MRPILTLLAALILTPALALAADAAPAPATCPVTSKACVLKAAVCPVMCATHTAAVKDCAECKKAQTATPAACCCPTHEKAVKDCAECKKAVEAAKPAAPATPAAGGGCCGAPKAAEAPAKYYIVRSSGRPVVRSSTAIAPGDAGVPPARPQPTSDP
jgi:hypothetical protein